MRETFRGPSRVAPISLLFWGLLLPGLAAAPAENPERLLRELVHPDPFVSERAEAELRKLGSDVLPALARALRSPEQELRLRVHRLFDELSRGFFLELEKEHRALELDRRELALLRERAVARADLERLRRTVKSWREADPDLERKIQTVGAFRSLQRQRAKLSPESKLEPDDERRFEELRREADAIEKEIPQLDQKIKDLMRYYELTALADSLADRRGVEALRIKDLEERVREREPAVGEFLEELRGIGTAAYGAMAGRIPNLPLRDLLEEGDLRCPAQTLYDELLAKALEELPDDAWKPDDAEFELMRYLVSPLWAREIDSGGPHKEEAEALVARHLRATVKDLDAPLGLLRERAALELFRLQRRGLDALLSGVGVADALEVDPGAAPHAFLANLLRWRISPHTYEKVGIHFGDYKRLPFAARRRRIFQYARAAGQDALQTLRAIVFDDALEDSFLVKYAAAKALSAQLNDRLGYLVLRSLYPEVLIKRPEISRDLRIIQGEKHMEAKDYASAVEEFSSILEEFPFDFEGNYRIALAYLLLKDYPKSIHHFEIARRINPNDFLTLYNLACAYSLGNKHTEALEALGASVKAGFHDAEHIGKDPDLDPIRHLPGFQVILDKLRASKK